MKSSYLFLPIILIFSLSSCQKEDNDPPNLPTEKSKLINKQFKLTDYKIIVNGNTYATINDLNTCSLDDLTTYKADNTTVKDAGQIKCNPQDPQQITFTYSINENIKQLIIHEIADTLYYTIKNNNGESFLLEHLEIDDFDSNGKMDTVMELKTYTKQ